MAALAHAQSFRCSNCDLLHLNFKRLLDTYREVCLRHLELEGISGASMHSQRQYRECQEAREAWVRHCKEHGCE